MSDYKNMRQSIIVVGAIGSGKTSLLLALAGNDAQARKTQAIIYDAKTIDTPGEFMENPMMNRYIISTAQGVETVLFIQDATRNGSIYPPGFAKSFTGKTVGVITKMDAEQADLARARRNLNELCLSGPVFETSSTTGHGIAALKEYLKLTEI